MGTLTHTTRPNMAPAVVFLTLLALCLPPTQGHGRLRNPASRASQWREGFDNPADYNDNQGFCGGADHQNNAMGGKWGICGDPFDGPWPHEAPGGEFANGNIVATYTQGETVKVSIEITANHLGYFTFKLCPNNNVNQVPDTDGVLELFHIAEQFARSQVRARLGPVQEVVTDRLGKSLAADLDLWDLAFAVVAVVVVAPLSFTAAIHLWFFARSLDIDWV